MAQIRVHIVDDLASTAGPLLQTAIADSIETSGRCRLALSGGSTPSSTLRWLADHLDSSLYANLWVTWADERHLPLGPGSGWEAWHRDSNVYLAARHWLSRAPEEPTRVLPLSAGGELDDAVRHASSVFRDDFGGSIDVALLGAGPDGHIASLFPDHPGLHAPGPLAAVRASPKPPPERITMSFDTLATARVVVLLARGAEKAAMLARAHGGDTSLPLSRLVPAGEVHWVLDSAAAARLP